MAALLRESVPPPLLTTAPASDTMWRTYARATCFPLCRIGQRNAVAVAGPFGFDSSGIRFGSEALSLDAVAQRDVVIVDEIGPLELQGGGWAPALHSLLTSYAGHLLLVVRPDILQQVLRQWEIQPVVVWDPDVNSAHQLAAQLSE